LPLEFFLQPVSGRHPDGRKEAAYEPSPIDSSTRHRKQIELWMTAFSPVRIRLETTAFPHLDSEITLDQWHFDV
jgi:hypothetical protein